MSGGMGEEMCPLCDGQMLTGFECNFDSHP